MEKFVLISLFLMSVSVGVSYGCSAGKQMIRSGGLSQHEKQAIVDEHNRLRQSVALGQVTSQPPAANMMEMKWDDELAARAQSWADNCMTAHDQANDRDVGRFPVGQNIAATWTTRRPSGPQDGTPDYSKQINAWFDEVRAYGFKPIGFSHGTGHYSQLVWGETSHVGCGFSFFYDPSRGYTKLYVCNYGPGGNVIGYKPYEKGQPACSTFGLSDSQKYSGLCADGYGNTINEWNFEHRNTIPESAPDSVDTSSYDAYNYKTYQTSNTYQWQTSSGNDQTYKPNPKVAAVYQSNTYKSNTDSETHTTQKPAPTYKPFVSIFSSTANNIGSTAQKVINNAITNTRRGFRFGTLYFK